MKIVRGYARNQADEKRLVATGIKPRYIYLEAKDSERWGRWKMRAGEGLGVVDGYRAFGASRRDIMGAVRLVKSWGAVIVDAETGKQSDRDGDEMLDEALNKYHGERTIPSSAHARKMQEASAKARTNGRMPKHEAEVFWFDPILDTATALALMVKWSQGSAYRAFGPRDVRAGRKPKSLAEVGNGRRGAIYFVQADGRGPVKIGFAKDVAARLKSLQTSHHGKLKLIAFIEGTPRHEKYLHQRFGEYRARGEWFKVAGEFKVYMEALTAPV